MKLIRILGMVMAAALALTAVDTASAAPTYFYSESASSEVKGADTNSAEEQHQFNFPELAKVGCDEPSFKTEMGKSAAEISTSGLEYKTCNGTWNPNGCVQVFHPGAKTEPGRFEGTFDLTCPAEKTFMIENYWATCDIKVYPKSGLKATYKNLGSGSSRAVKISLGGEEVKYETLTQPLCPKGSGEDGTMTGSWEVKAYSGGKQVGAWLEPALGIFLESVSHPKEYPPFTVDFKADLYPRHISGTQGPAHTFTTPQLGNSSEMSCKSAGFDGGTLSSSSPKLPVTASYSECSFNSGFGAIVEMNSCSYLFETEPTEAPPYYGTQKITCSKEGDSLVYKLMSFGAPICTLSFPPQTIGSGSYKNLGEGGAKHVLAEVEGKGLTYTLTEDSKFLCPAESGGTFKDGKFSGGTDFVGVD